MLGKKKKKEMEAKKCLLDLLFGIVFFKKLKIDIVRKDAEIKSKR